MLYVKAAQSTHQDAARLRGSSTERCRSSTRRLHSATDKMIQGASTGESRSSRASSRQRRPSGSSTDESQESRGTGCHYRPSLRSTVQPRGPVGDTPSSSGGVGHQLRSRSCDAARLRSLSSQRGDGSPARRLRSPTTVMSIGKSRSSRGAAQRHRSETRGTRRADHHQRSSSRSTVQMTSDPGGEASRSTRTATQRQQPSSSDNERGPVGSADPGSTCRTRRSGRQQSSSAVNGESSPARRDRHR